MSLFKILVVGGYGSFGQFISSALVDEADVFVVIGGRSSDRAKACAKAIRRNKKLHNIEGMYLDLNTVNLCDLLKQHKIDMLINASGNFLKQDYSVPEACIEARCHYVDLADNREFVRGITKLDTNAVKQGVTVVSGASSVPGLSSAVINHFSSNFSQIDSVEYSIVPGFKAPKGLATVKSILSYTGQAFKRWQDSRWVGVFGWQDLRRHDYGDIFGKKWVASCDIPDLELFPETYKGIKSVKFYAGLELSILQFAMWGMSWLARIKIIKNWSQYASLLTSISLLFERFGSDCGGMSMQIKGVTKSGRRKNVTWRLVAKNGHGPRVPCIASIILAKKLARGERAYTGAEPCVGLFSLKEFSEECKYLDITQDVSVSEQEQVGVKTIETKNCFGIN